MTPSTDPAIALTSATDDLIASIGQPREMIEADLPRLEALASAIVEHARALSLLLSTLPPDFQWGGDIPSVQEEVERIVDYMIESFSITSREVDAYLLAAVHYQLAPTEPAA